MKKLFVVLSVLALAALMVAGCAEKSPFSPQDTDSTASPFAADQVLTFASNNAVNGTPIEGQYIVVLKQTDTVNLQSSKQAVRDASEALLSKNSIAAASIQHVYHRATTGFSASLSADQAALLARESEVAYVEQDKVVTLTKKPDNPGGGNGGGGGGGDPAQITPWGISRVGGSTSGVGSTAWIIDTGIDLDHPDLTVDSANGFSAFGNGPDSSPDDLNGHGTHVAGTVAAIDNSIGVVGVAAGATVVPVKVLDRRGSGSVSSVVAGIDYVAANAGNGDAANMSLGGGVSSTIDNAVLNAAGQGVRFAIAAGNESQHANNSSPARVEHNNVYTVSAIDDADVFAWFSNYGNPPVDYAAPGVNILSTYKDGAYAYSDGTSMASPHVCGLLVLGTVHSDGFAINDPDGNPDPIAHN